jgi:hypothetical protein
MPNKLPTWQRKIHANVSAAIKRGNPIWGRRYATFLARECKRLDDAFGKSALRTPNLKTKASERSRMIVEAIATANPDWTVREIAQAAGVSVYTAHTYRPK